MATTSSPRLPLYAQLLGDAWAELDPRVRRAHLDGERLSMVGTFRVRRGTNVLSRLLASCLRLPAAGDAVAVRLTVLPTEGGERWIRAFGPTPLVSNQAFDEAGIFRERFGGVEFRIRLEPGNGGIVYRQVGVALRVGFVTIPLPRWFAPHVESFEEPSDAGTYVSVRVLLPLTGLIISYDGRIVPEEPA
jgi:hypothetical protein